MALPKIWTKIENENASRILIFPLFLYTVMISRLLRTLIKAPIILPESHSSLYFPHRRKKMPTRPGINFDGMLHIEQYYGKRGISERGRYQHTHAIMEERKQKPLQSVHHKVDTLLVGNIMLI